MLNQYKDWKEWESADKKTKKKKIDYLSGLETAGKLSMAAALGNKAKEMLQTMRKVKAGNVQNSGENSPHTPTGKRTAKRKPDDQGVCMHVDCTLCMIS